MIPTYADPIEFIHEALEKLSDADAIAWATCALEDLLQQQLAILKIRAHRFSKQSKYEQALGDCMSVIDKAPTVAASYLLHGDLCSIQGFMQAAVRTYDQGLRRVKTISDKEVLEVAKAEAEAKLATKVDFIARVPPEIASHIIQRIIPNWIQQGSSVFLVSKIWQTRFIELSDDLGVIVDAIEADKALVAKAMPHASRLLIQRAPSDVLATLATCPFHKLRSLSISDLVMQDNGLLQKALRCIGKTLTSLWLGMHAKSPVPLFTALSACPKLETFVGVGGSLQTQYEQDILDGGNYPQLKDLSMVLYNGLDDAHLKYILIACPSLVYLNITGCTAAAGNLRWCQQYGNNLNVLSFKLSEAELDIYSFGRKEMVVKQGLQDLSVEHIPETAWPNLIELVKQHRRSLKCLTIDIASYDPMDREISVPMFSSTELLDNLTSFTMDGSQQPMIKEVLASLISHAPRLESLVLRFVTGINRQLLEPISALDHLKRIRLVYCNRLHYGSLGSFFQKHAALGDQSPLEEVHLENISTYSTRATERTLMALTNIRTLTALTLGGQHNFSTKGSVHFMNKLALNARRLTAVSLTRTSSINDAALEQLSRSKSLKSLHLSGIENITCAVLMHFARANRLSSLNIQDCKNVDWNAFRLAHYYLCEKDNTVCHNA